MKKWLVLALYFAAIVTASAGGGREAFRNYFMGSYFFQKAAIPALKTICAKRITCT
ncbi:MAG: hypothetical protein R2795_13245 [Saprospiraceae bacterium]